MGKDQLEDYLANKYKDYFFHGENNMDLLVWGTENRPMCCSINIGIDYKPLEGVTGYQLTDAIDRKVNTIAAKRLLKYAAGIANSTSVPVYAIVYPTVNDYKNRWEESIKKYKKEDIIFYLFDLAKNVDGKVEAIKYNGASLAEYLHKLFGIEKCTIGSSKKVNSHLSDYFHFWSRNSLSSSITKIDFDGIIINNKSQQSILIEIKRSNKPHIPNWGPHPDDIHNYEMEYSFANSINAKFWLLHHEDRGCDENEIISFYDISGVDSSCKDYLLTNEKQLEMKIAGTNSLENRIENFI